MGENPAEYRTLIHHTADLQSAVKSQLVSVGAGLMSRALIAPHKYDELINYYVPEATRAAELVRLIQNKVKQNPRCYYSFIATLQEDQAQYGDILRKLQYTYQLNLQEDTLTSLSTPVTPMTGTLYCMLKLRPTRQNTLFPVTRPEILEEGQSVGARVHLQKPEFNRYATS